MHCEWLSLNKSKTIKKRIKDTDIVFGCSKYISDKIAENYPEFKYKINTLYNGFDPETNAGGVSDRLRGIDFGNVPIPRTIQFSLKGSF